MKTADLTRVRITFIDEPNPQVFPFQKIGAASEFYQRAMKRKDTEKVEIFSQSQWDKISLDETKRKMP